MHTDIKSKIRQRRAQILIHSCLYYLLDDPIVSDDQWQAWANELAKLQEEHGHKIGYYDRHFFGWDGSSGNFLPLKNPEVYEKAIRMLKLHSKYAAEAP